MKRFKKVKLINWHSFYNNTLTWENINVITGENGTGKSTILDAIYYVLSGGDSKFNRAANTLGTGRNVENYLKARIGGEKREFLRNESNIIGHIALEFYDETYRRPYVIGVVLQLIEGKLDAPAFFEIIGGELVDELFIDEDKINGFDELFKVAKSKNLDIHLIGSKRDSMKKRKLNVAKALGIDTKYQLLLLKAMSFEPLQEIDRFATDFFLEEEQVDLSNIKAAMDSYKEIAALVKIENEKASLLKNINDIAPKYEEILKKEFALNILWYDAKIENDIYSKEKNEKTLIILNDECENTDSLIAFENQQISTISQKIESINNNESFKVIKELKIKLDEYVKEFNAVQNEVSKREQKMDSERIIASKFGTSLDFTNVKLNKDYSTYLTMLKNYDSRIQKFVDDAKNLYSENNAKLKELNNKKSDLIQEIDKLKKDDYAYPSFVEKLIVDIKSAIKNQYGVEDVYISPLCSLCEITDEKYRKVIEGYLNKKRFDLFLPTKYFSLAKKIFDSKIEFKDYFGVGVIDTNSLNENIEIDSNSLASKIEAIKVKDGVRKELSEPTKYIKSLLSDINIFDSLDEFIEGKKCITPSGLYSDGYSLRQIDFASANKPYIGRETIKTRLHDAELELQRVEEELINVNKVIERSDEIINLQKRTKVYVLLEEKNHYSDYEIASTKVEETNKNIKDLEESSDDFIFMSEQITTYEKDKKNKEKFVSKLESENNDRREKIGFIKHENLNLENDIAYLTSSKNDALENKNIKFADFNAYLADLRGNLKRNELLNFVNEEKRRNSISKTNTEDKIKISMNDYNARFPGSMMVDVRNYKEYVSKYNKIKNDELAKLQPEVKASHDKALEALKEQFLNSLRSNLKRAQADIALLNRTLKNHPFGSNKEVFVFKANKSNDKLLGEVYRIAMETNQSGNIDSLFSEYLDDRSLSVLDEVFEILTSNEDDPKMVEKRKEISDYRRYFHYEIEIHINNDENILYYSKNSNSKSGGETQTPFYALIAGAFQMKINDNEKVGRSPIALILFDEAFNNMDGERIKQMLEFYKELKIQLIISVPSIRFSYIAPYSDGITSLVKIGDEVGIYQSTEVENGI